MKLKLVEQFKELFKTNHRRLLNCSLFSNLVESIHSSEDVINLPNIILYGPDGMVLNECVNVLMAHITKSTMPAIKKDEPTSSMGFAHHWHPQYLTIDAGMLLSDEKINYINHVRTIVSHDCLDPITGRHIMVINNIHNMSAVMECSLRKLIENASTCLFVLTTTSLSTLDYTLTSRCMMIRCCVNVFDVQDDVMDLLRIERRKNKDGVHKRMADKSRGNVTKFLIMLERNSTSFLLENFLENRLEGILKSNDHSKAMALITDTAARLETSGVRPAAICCLLIDVCQAVDPDTDMCQMTSLLSQVQSKMLLSNRYSFVLEELLYSIVNIMKQ